MRVVMDLNRLQAHRNLVHTLRLPALSGFALVPTPSSSSSPYQSAVPVDSSVGVSLFMRLVGWLGLPRANAGCFEYPLGITIGSNSLLLSWPRLYSVSALSMRLLNGPGFSGSFFLQCSR